MMVKWIWRFGREEDSLWRKFLCAKYKLDSNLIMWDVSEISNGSQFVKALRKFYDNNHRVSRFIKQGFQIVIGSGNRTRLWHDIRWDQVPLKVAFPRIFALASNKNGVISKLGSWAASMWNWDVKLRRSLFNWEIDQWNGFKLVLENIKLRNNIQDALAWHFCPNGIFSVSSFRRCLEESGDHMDEFFPFIWKGICPPKIEVFTWQLLKGRLMVREVLRRFGVNGIVSVECPLCLAGSESIDHLFLQCTWSNKLWRLCMGVWGVHSCSNATVSEWLLGWNGFCSSRSSSRVWNILFFAVIWTIWECRNEVVFRGIQADVYLAMDTIKFRVALWFKNFGCGSSSDLTLLMLDPKERCVDQYTVKTKNLSGWLPPVGNALLFNIGGSSRGNPGDAGIGGVLRDANGKVFCLFSYYVGILDSNAAEVHAIHKACSLISSHPILRDRCISIVSDSRSAVSWINSDNFGNINLVNLVYDIRYCIQSCAGISIIHTNRESNTLADSLAKGGSGKICDRLEWSVS
ncbi:hypothetical protein Dsin_016252 [Dipteronia sinensis]|uniref:RNase H type-1 domain-containing protein n=1 Tax=Dipteronia sinensis TaxID=43782 RepID=A0AAE0ADE1_9ROSI|nr:hypothetical protein Dsin_016252 [Dipteronia sinensis]